MDRTAHVADLVKQRLGASRIQWLSAIAAGRRFATVDSIGVIDEGALDLKESYVS